MSGAGEAAGGGSKLQSPLLAAASGPATTSAGGGDGGHGVSRQLEGILRDGSRPWPRRALAASAVELRLLTRLAAPAVLVYTVNYLMSMSTQIFSGHLGTLELAAASLGSNGIQIFTYGLMVRDRPQSLSSESDCAAFRSKIYYCIVGLFNDELMTTHSQSSMCFFLVSCRSVQRHPERPGPAGPSGTGV
ncbi:protein DETOXIFICATION 40-like [Panicum virgatum]|uniref:protein DETOXIFICATION 40-like n=1 Tax=Panicum virgatum TaxID=38727 RepID=UPI0019D50CD5|nr:protein DETOXIFICATION 40-like [Panicum virgatum]